MKKYTFYLLSLLASVLIVAATLDAASLTRQTVGAERAHVTTVYQIGE